MGLDLAFLQVPLTGMSTQPRPVNVYEILREGWRETRVDMTLQFFLDPNERHGLGTIVIDALLTTLDGARVVGPEGLLDATFNTSENLRSKDWEIGSQVDFIDVYAVNRELGVAVVLENKINHILDNPLDRYAQRALADEDISTLLVTVLAPDRRVVSGSQAAWLSRAITYRELSDNIKASPRLVEHLLGPRDRDQVRSLDLLEQFMEARSGGSTMAELEHEDKRLTEWRELVSKHGEAIDTFMENRRRMTRLLRDRGKRLAPLIAERLEAAGLATDWESHAGISTEFWNAYHFPHVAWTVELKLSTDPAYSPIFTYDYEGRSYRQERVIPLGLTWDVADEQIADTFLERVVAILDEVSRASEQSDTSK